jgi:hypothetical protein
MSRKSRNRGTAKGEAAAEKTIRNGEQARLEERRKRRLVERGLDPRRLDGSSETSPDQEHGDSGAESIGGRTPRYRAPEDESRRRHFDVDRILEKASQAHLDRSVEFERVSEALGTRDTDFVWGLIIQIIDAVGEYHQGEAIGFALSVIKEQRPRDHLERMLVAHAVVAHLAAMRFAEDLSPGLNFEVAQRDFALKAATSFSRLFASHLSALKQYRSGGEQRVTVRHVSVSDGAQAIVGNVNNQRAIEETSRTSPRLTDARRVPMDPLRERDLPRVRSGRSDEE